MRLAGRERLGFYPLPAREAERIRRFLVFPNKPCCALDPCVGRAPRSLKSRLTKMLAIRRRTGRWPSGTARTKGIEVIHGNCFDVQCPVESFSLIYLNPPYDFDNRRTEIAAHGEALLEHVHRWLIRGGILVFVVPAKRITIVLRCLQGTSETRVCIGSRKLKVSVISKSSSWGSGVLAGRITGGQRYHSGRSYG